MSDKAKELSYGTFDAAIESGISLVDFWAPWCPPCRMQGPIVEKLADSFAGKALIAKINVDENGSTAAKYGVANIPTIIIFKDGKEAKRMVGLQQEAALVDAINGLL